ncbi:LPS-assembly lipoprotein LptE [Thiomicrorhabdus cannonii]|uniref:LPS-assembly lipoprotein LptE n=1 Tax=Thiomicrorhabdus cannonii TaxID=2748011 RepID=UPI0015C1267A|nr:LPS assembly lipoprotein LptE [Thiomicrorhabdus cannonii]
MHRLSALRGRKKTQQAGLRSSSAFAGRLKFILGFLVVLLSVELLSGCGFHLRGVGSGGEAQFQSVKLDGAQQLDPQLREALQQQLAVGGVRLADTLGSAQLWVQFDRTDWKQTRTGYSGGDVASILLTLKQHFKVQDVASETWILDAQATTYRDHTIDLNARLASDRELQEIREQMSDEVARQIIDRINRALAQQRLQSADGQTKTE